MLFYWNQYLLSFRLINISIKLLTRMLYISVIKVQFGKVEIKFLKIGLLKILEELINSLTFSSNIDTKLILYLLIFWKVYIYFTFYV